MKKNLAKRILALTVSVTMVLSMSAVALATDATTAGSGSVDIETELKEGIINVVVPTSVKVSIDPLEILDTTNGSQVNSASYTFINKSNVDVQLDIVAWANPGTGVTQVDTKGAISGTTAKQVWLNITPAQATTIDATAPAAPVVHTTTLPTYKVTAETTLPNTYADAKPIENGKARTISFALNKATYTSADAFEKLATGFEGKSTASFKFTGLVNPSQNYTADDMKVNLVYTVLPQSATTYALTRGASDANLIAATGYDSALTATTSVALTLPTISITKANVAQTAVASGGNVASTSNMTLTYTEGTGVMAGSLDQTKGIFLKAGGADFNLLALDGTYFTIDTTAKTIVLNASLLTLLDKGTNYVKMTVGKTVITANFNLQ